MTIPGPSGASLRTLSLTLARVLTRESFRFSPSGTAAACIAGDGQGARYLEAWSFTGPSPRWWPLPLTQAVTHHTLPIPLDDGRVLLWREGIGNAPNGNHADAHEIVLLEGRGGGERAQGAPEETVREQVLGTIPSDGLIGLRLLPGPGAAPVRGSRAAVLGTPPPMAIAISIDRRGYSTIWRLAADPPHLQRLAEIPSPLSGGVWLDRAGVFLGAERAESDGAAKAVALDLRDGSYSPLLFVSKTSNDRLLGCGSRSGLLLVSTDAPGEERLGWAKLGSGERVRFPETLHRPGQAAHLLTFDRDGERMLLQFDEGVRSRLAIYTPDADHLAAVEIPPGFVYQAACWTGNLARFPFSAPAQPPGVATLRLGDAPGWSIAGSAPAAAGARWVDAHVERLEGAAGPIEAIVYGGQDWRASRHLLLALHGGPVDAWRLEFEPLFQSLAAAGIAIVAPNQRGSSGYGMEHAALAIRSGWGGADLDDVRCIARALDTQRRAVGAPGLMLLGVSYGAFLALLAASLEPHLWSRCVALAPFLSGRRLHREATPGVQGMLEQLGGLRELHDDLGPRDVLRLCHALQVELLIVHGGRDEQVPVSQSRALRQRLLERGRCEGVDFEYLEIPDGGHDLATGPHSQALHEQIASFLVAGPQSNRAPGP